MFKFLQIGKENI